MLAFLTHVLSLEFHLRKIVPPHPTITFPKGKGEVKLKKDTASGLEAPPAVSFFGKIFRYIIKE
jgi:hypothetical protein